MERDPFLKHLYDQISDSPSQKRIFDLLKLIFVYKINREALESQCFQGIPDDCNGLRPLCWRLLLGYLPASPNSWGPSLESYRKQYENYVTIYFIPHITAVSPNKMKETKQAFGFKKNDFDDKNTTFEERTKTGSSKKQVRMIEPDNDDHPLSTKTDSKWNTYYKDQKLWEDIIKDTKRTRSNMEFFQGFTNYALNKTVNDCSDLGIDEKETHIDVLTRMLFIYAKLNPNIGYMQGMNEILAPIYYCFYNDFSPMFLGKAEADAFFCFSNLMKEIQDGFVKKLEGGIQTRIKILNEMLKKVDKQLWTHLDKHKVNPQFYSLKWLMLLLAQEFSIDDVLKIWDRLFSHPKKLDFLNYICLAIIGGMRETIMNADDFATIMETLQKDVSTDIEKLISTAFRLYKQYAKSEEVAHHLTYPQ